MNERRGTRAQAEHDEPAQSLSAAPVAADPLPAPRGVDTPLATQALALGHPSLSAGQRHALARSIGQHFGNQHLAAVVARASLAPEAPGGRLARATLARQPAAPATNPEKLKKALQDDDEVEAIRLFGVLTDPEAATVLGDGTFKTLAVGAFGDSEMNDAMLAVKGDLRLRLEWMFAEDTSFGPVRAVINKATVGHERVRASMVDQFVSLCGNTEMAEVVDLLKGDLKFKLEWMKAEGTSWSLVRPKLQTTANDAEKLPIRNDWRGFFVDLCDNDEMGHAVQLLGGTLEWKLGWMKEEGVDYARLVQVIAGTSNDAERQTIRASDTWKAFFVETCDNKQMAAVVAGLGGDLAFRLSWMKEEGTDWVAVRREITRAPEPEKAALRGSDDWKRFLVETCNDKEMSEAVDLLGGDLAFKLKWMQAEDANWANVKEKLAVAAEPEKALARASPEMKAFFVATCDNKQMAEAVTILGGDLAFKLDWMKEEGADWPQLKAVVAATTLEAERAPVRTDAWRAFFVDICDDQGMSEAVDLLGGDLKFKLSWMNAEDASWAMVKDKLVACTDEAQRTAVRDDEAMKAFFVSVCGNAEMAEAVDLLGGTLVWKLKWMKEEGAGWHEIDQRINATADEAQRKAALADPATMAWLKDTLDPTQYRLAESLLANGPVANDLDPETAKSMGWDELKIHLLAMRDPAKQAAMRTDAWRDAFVSVCGNDEMAEAVDLVGGDLTLKLSWMKEEGTDWELVRPKLVACTVEAEKAAIRTDVWKEFFVGLCGNTEMAEVVRLLGGDLRFKLTWMLGEGTSTELVMPVVAAAPQADKDAVAADKALCEKLLAEVGPQVFETLGAGPHAAAAMIDAGGADNNIQALRIIATSPNIATTVTTLRGLSKLETLLDSSPRGRALGPAARAHVDAIYAGGGLTMAEKQKMIRVRYDKEISDEGIDGKAAFAWSIPALDAVYQVLAQLPEGAVLDNRDLRTIHMVVSGIGTYYSGYKALHLPGGPTYNMATATWGGTVVVEQHFQGTIRHEVGHAIDKMVDGEAWYTEDPNIDWDISSGVGDWLGAMEALGGWGPVSDEDERKQIRAAIKTGLSDARSDTATLPGLPADPNHPFNRHAGTCPIVRAVIANTAEGAFNAVAGLPSIGGRVFIRRPVYGKFYSFKETARNPPVWISNYGLSAPSDWFAEQIREYFRTSPPGANTADFVKSWFMMNLP